MPIDPNRVRDIFLAVLDLATDVRAGYLDEACGGDADLRTEVDRLLLANADPDSILETPAPQTVDLTDKSAPNAASSPSPTEAATPNPAMEEGTADRADLVYEDTGTASPRPRTAASNAAVSLGTVVAQRYTLIEVIGEGGMGSVYRADQTEPVKRQVALKLIKTGMDSRGVIARFDAERQALALMDHPNIARIFDGGLTPSGQPFFVMELVNGEPLTEYCDKRRLSIKARLELFVAVCQAVQHAHQKGIIHRDLKPSNILVTEIDGKPTPKVIDFGVAKATEVRLTDMSLADTGAIVGTPTSLSPEQADPSSMDIDTRSDVYSLGVILYELLAGSPPLEAKHFRRGAVLEMLRMVREVEPPRPSTKLSTADALPSIAANRGTEPAQLRNAVRGDLDWVVMKALEKDRERRYETANGFAADILRHLADEPVLAAPPSRGYRLRKFVRKHRGPVIAASLLLITLLAGIGGTTWGLIVADRALIEEGRRLIERDDARKKEAERAEELEYRLGVTNMVLAEAAFDKSDVLLASEQLNKVPMEQRGWEWSYLKQQTRGGLMTLFGHSLPVSAVAYSPDGRLIVTGSWDNTAKVWDSQTGTSLKDLKGHSAQVTSVGFSPDGTRIVTGSDDKTVKVWDVGKGKSLFELKGHADKVTSVAFSPDGKMIVTGSWDNLAKVWDARTGEWLLDLEGHGSTVASVSFSPDSSQVLTGSFDGTATVWSAMAGKALLQLKGHRGFVASAAFSPNGGQIVTGGSDGVVKVWDARTGTQLLDIKGHKLNVWCVGYSPDGNRIVTGGFDRIAKVWDARSGALVLELIGHTGIAMGVTFSPDASRIITASSDGTAKIWDSRTGNHFIELRGHKNELAFVVFNPDGKKVVTGGADGGKVWDTRTGEFLFDVVHQKSGVSAMSSASFSPDGKRIATGGADRTVRIRDAETGDQRLELQGHLGAVTSMSFSPDGTRIVTGSSDKTARVWDSRTGKLELELKGHSELLWCVSFSPDGKRIITGGYNPTAMVWDSSNGSLLLNLKGHGGGVHSASFSPDGTRIVTGSGDKTAKIWDARTGAQLLELKGHSFEVECVQFSPDGSRVVTASADQTVKVWEARTGTALLELKGHTGKVTSVSISPDGRRIASASADGTARIWEARPWTPLVELNTRINVNSHVSWSIDGTRIVTTNENEASKVWDAQTGRQDQGSLLPSQTSEGMISPDARIIAFDAGTHVELIPLQPDLEELEYRRLNMRPNLSRYRQDYEAAKRAGDEFALQFYLKLLPKDEQSRLLAKEILEPLFARLGLCDEVLAAIKAHPANDPNVQAACLEMAATWREESAFLANLAWSLVSVPERPENDYRLGLRLAEFVTRLNPDFVGFPNVLGMAQYRSDRFEEALTTLTRANELNQFKIPTDLAFLAMAQHRLGQAEKARDTLLRLRERTKERANDPRVNAFMHTAEANFLREAEAIEFDLSFPENPFAP